MTTHNWLLPENVEDILPAQAWHIENLRRHLVDLFRVNGYQLVVPPLLEYLPSLLTGTGYDMDTKTFKLVDQLSGRMMGLRADITPQAARIDAHLLNRQGVVRLCYAGSVVHTLPDGLMKTREPLQVGVELFGHAGIEADVEVQQLMLDALEIAGVKQVHLDLGHVGIFRSLIKHGNVSPGLEADLFGALQGKDNAGLAELSSSLVPPVREALCLLPTLFGNAEEIVAQARHCLPDYPEISAALTDLENIAAQLHSRVGRLCIDLAELRGYHYHSGVVFAAYSEGWANAIAQGGRYDMVGQVFGRSRPATGFSLDLRSLCDGGGAALARSILAPYVQDKDLRDTINALRTQGQTVIVDLPGHEAQQGELECDRRLVKRHGSWQVENI